MNREADPLHDRVAYRFSSQSLSFGHTRTCTGPRDWARSLYHDRQFFVLSPIHPAASSFIGSNFTDTRFIKLRTDLLSYPTHKTIRFVDLPQVANLKLRQYGGIRRAHRPDRLPLSDNRKARWRRDGRGLQGRRHAPASFRRTEISP